MTERHCTGRAGRSSRSRLECSGCVIASLLRVRYRPEVASAVAAVDLCARPNALFPSTGRAQDHGTARGCKTAKVPRLDVKPGAVKSSDLRNRLLAVEALNQHAIGRREHYSAIDSGAAVDVDGFGRSADDCDEQRHSVIDARAAQELQRTESAHTKVPYRALQIRWQGSGAKGGSVIELQAHHGRDTVFEQPTRIGSGRTLALPQH